MAADSRGTIGDPRGLTAINDSMTKLFRLSQFVGILSYGQAELAAQLINEIKSELAPEDLHFSALFEKARQRIREKYQSWLGSLPPEQRPPLGFIMAGFEHSGEAKIYYLSSHLSFAPQLCTTGIALGGIPQYATYLAHRLYDPEMTIGNLISLAAYIISETATQDPKVGGPIKIAQISPNKGYMELSETGVAKIVQQNNELNKKLRDFFFPREEVTNA